MFAGCWDPDPKKRPSFKEIVTKLEEIARSPFVGTTNETFQSIQDGWHAEIEDMYDNLRLQENVSLLYIYSMGIQVATTVST